MSIDRFAGMAAYLLMPPLLLLALACFVVALGFVLHDRLARRQGRN